MKKRLVRRDHGISALEVTIATFLVVVAAAIGVDITILSLGYTFLDTTTRDAARAAGSQQTSAAAVQAAQSQLSIHQTDGTFVQQPTLINTASPYFVYQDFGGQAPPNPNQSPYVTVTCQEKIHLPVNIGFFGVNLGTLADANGYLTIARQYTFPIVKAKYYAPTD
jgi:Flp pilus assembly protein TadG